MSSNRVQLSGKDILEKDFKTAMRGYNQVEVDEFLDVIIKDYEMLNEKINKLQLENERLKKQQTSVPTRTRPIQQQEKQPIQPVNQVNYDILKRISNLEKEVFGKKYVDTNK